MSFVMEYLQNNKSCYNCPGVLLSVCSQCFGYTGQSSVTKTSTFGGTDQYVPEAATGALAGGCGGLWCTGPCHGGAPDSLSQANGRRASFKDPRATALPGAVLHFFHLRQRNPQSWRHRKE